MAVALTHFGFFQGVQQERKTEISEQFCFSSVFWLNWILAFVTFCSYECCHWELPHLPVWTSVYSEIDWRWGTYLHVAPTTQWRMEDGMGFPRGSTPQSPLQYWFSWPCERWILDKLMTFCSHCFGFFVCDVWHFVYAMSFQQNVKLNIQKSQAEEAWSSFKKCGRTTLSYTLVWCPCLSVRD